jgi:hypothetical protein
VTTLRDCLSDQAVDEQQYNRSHRSHQYRPHIEASCSRAAKDPSAPAINPTTIQLMMPIFSLALLSLKGCPYCWGVDCTIIYLSRLRA